MKKLKNVILVLIAGNFCVSCETMSSTVVSTVAGAGIGAVVGHQSGRATEGALIGAATGLLGSEILRQGASTSSYPSRTSRQRPPSSSKPSNRNSKPASSGYKKPPTQIVKANQAPASSSASAGDSGSLAVTDNGVIEY